MAQLKRVDGRGHRAKNHNKFVVMGAAPRRFPYGGSDGRGNSHLRITRRREVVIAFSAVVAFGAPRKQEE